jgi:hypothetical protein
MRTYHYRMMISELHSPTLCQRCSFFFSAKRSYEFLRLRLDIIQYDEVELFYKISILAITAVLTDELHFPILPNFDVDATSFHVLMHLIWIIWWGGNQTDCSKISIPVMIHSLLTFVSTSHRFFSHSRKDNVRFLRWYIWCYRRIALRSLYLLSSWSPPATPFPDNVVSTYAKTLVTSYHILIWWRGIVPRSPYDAKPMAFFSIAEMILRNYTTVSPSVSDKVDRYIYQSKSVWIALDYIVSSKFLPSELTCISSSFNSQYGRWFCW